jgi:hypothetical protein
MLARHVEGEPNGITGVFALAEARAAKGDWARTAVLLDHIAAMGGGHDPAVLSLRIKAARALDRPVDARHFATLLALVAPRPLGSS